MTRWFPGLLMATVLLGLISLNLSWLQSPVDISPVLPQVPSANRQEAATFVSSSGEDFGAAVSESLARPLFHQTRRPFQPPPETIEEPVAVVEEPAFEEEPAIPVEEPPPVDKPVLRLVGISAANGLRRALLATGEEGAAPRWRAVGDSVEGWTVDAITGGDVTLANGSERFTVALYPAGNDRAPASELEVR